MPWDSTAQREASGLGNQAADARVDLRANFNRAEQELGFGAGANNPYSQAAQLKEQHTANARGITNAAGNQLYAGSTANQQSAARQDFDAGQKQLEDTYAQAQGAYATGTARTDRDFSEGMGAIKEGAIGRALASEPEPLAVGGGQGRGRGRAGVGAEGRNIRRPAQARRLNAQARAINARINSRGRGR